MTLVVKKVLKILLVMFSSPLCKFMCHKNKQNNKIKFIFFLNLIKIVTALRWLSSPKIIIIILIIIIFNPIKRKIFKIKFLYSEIFNKIKTLQLIIKH